MLKYAVVNFYIDEEGFLDSEVWGAEYSLEEAEQKRIEWIKSDHMSPQNFQVIQYVE